MSVIGFGKWAFRLQALERRRIAALDAGIDVATAVRDRCERLNRDVSARMDNIKALTTMADVEIETDQIEKIVVEMETKLAAALEALR